MSCVERYALKALGFDAVDFKNAGYDFNEIRYLFDEGTAKNLFKDDKTKLLNGATAIEWYDFNKATGFGLGNWNWKK